MMNEYGYWGSWLGHGLFGGVLMILFWAAVIYFIIWLVRSNTTINNNGKKPIDYLKERYLKVKLPKNSLSLCKKILLTKLI